MKKTKLAIIFGTRPEIIKLAPLIRLCQKRKLAFFCLHTGQHFSFEMDKIFIRELKLPLPKYRLETGAKSFQRHGAQVGYMLSEIERIFLKENPSVVVVEGDTNTVLAGSLAAGKIPESKNGGRIKIAHVEAGLRSYDRRMPEETNRVIVDHLSDFLFAPTGEAKTNLLNEGVPKNKIYVVGNTIVDIVLQSYDLVKNKNRILNKLGLKKGQYILLTMHRQENVDSREMLRELVQGVAGVYKNENLPIVFPIHPRTVKKMEQFNIRFPEGVQVIKPLGYFDFIMLEANAKLILTDSGGVQEEACILQVPCVTLRDNTERPETVEVGSNCIAGTKSENIISCARQMSKAKKGWKNPFGDGHTAERILKTITG